MFASATAGSSSTTDLADGSTPDILFERMMERIPPELLNELLRGTVQDLVDDMTLEVVFEMHRKLKRGQLCLNCNAIDTVDKSGFDIYGQSIKAAPSEVFECINCKRSVAASRFAPHLEKCMGQGRNSSRLANKRLNALSSNHNSSSSSASSFVSSSSASSFSSLDRDHMDLKGTQDESDDEYKDDGFDFKPTETKKKPGAPSLSSAPFSVSTSSASSSSSSPSTFPLLSNNNKAKVLPSQLIKKPKGRPRKNAAEPEKTSKQTKLTVKSLKATVVKGKKGDNSVDRMDVEGQTSPQVSESMYVDIVGDDSDGKDAFGILNSSWSTRG